MLKAYDNTTLSTAKRCLRLHYYKHERGWIPEGAEPALVFGESWHAGQDVVWSMLENGQVRDNRAVVMAAMTAFIGPWVRAGFPALGEATPEQLSDLEPRTPAIAMEMFYNYVAARKSFIQRCKLIAVERPFVVPLNAESTMLYAGKIDKVVEVDGKVLILDHKTTTLYSKSDGIRGSYLESFSPNSQFDGYLYAGAMQWNASAVWADVALVHKTEHDVFKFVPIERQFAQLDGWLWGTQYWVNQIEANREAALGQEANSYLAAWPQNTNACFDFNRTCPYINICKAWPNPAKQVEPPPGFKVEFWSPFEENQLAELGLKRD